jgi:hypothetical protein
MAMVLSAAAILWSSVGLPAGATVQKVAIFVENRAEQSLNDKMPVLEDFLSSRLTGKGYSVISHEDAIGALSAYSIEGVASESSPEEKLDEALRSSTSALRLAQNLGADYIFLASISSYGKEKRVFESADLNTENVIHTLRVSYKLLEASRGGSLIGDVVKVTKTERSTANSSTENSDLLNGLLDEAAELVADNAGNKRDSIKDEPTAAAQVQVSVSCGMQDLANLPISVPDVVLNADGTVTVVPNGTTVQVLDASVEVNGTVVGTAPGTISVPSGLNKIRITREGFSPWERTVSFHEGQNLKVALRMSEEGYARWKDNTAFLANIESGKKLTDATVKMMEGFAQTLRQSGYRVDTKTDVKANIETKGKSLLDGANIKLLGN